MPNRSAGLRTAKTFGECTPATAPPCRVPGRGTTLRPALIGERQQLVRQRRADRLPHGASVRFTRRRELRAVVDVRGVAPRAGASAERDLTQRPEALHYGLLVFHATCLPKNVNPGCAGID